MSYIKDNFLLTNKTAETLYSKYAKDMPIDYWIDYGRRYQDPATERIWLKDEIAAAKAAKEAESK